uniref:Uncharacterized protein n=1 Tax=Nothobranchius kuhntae TaxID=321403 RepID=A0A1A8I2R8_NOTKU
MSLLAYRGPRSTPRPRLACPKMTLRQICRMLKMMKQVRTREAAAAASLCVWFLFTSPQEAVFCVSYSGVARSKVGEEMPLLLSEAQTQR